MNSSFPKQIVALFIIILVAAFSARAEDAPQEDAPLSQSELEDLVGPIAIYPDPLLAQILPASTYPLEIVEAARMIHDKDDFDKIDEQNWDPSVKAVAHYPSVLKKMSDDLSWTQKLGQAVLTQQDDVMQSIQTLRQRAEAAGNLKTTKQQVVKKVIVKEYVEPQIEILPADPEIIYVPVYNPRVVYVMPIYPVRYPVISFGYGFSFGSWLNIGFYWPARTFFYAGPTYWHGYWGAGWSPAYVHRTVIHNTYVTNVYSTRSVVTRNGVIRSAWAHNSIHGNPYNGRTVKTAVQPRYTSKEINGTRTLNKMPLNTKTSGTKVSSTSTKKMSTTQVQNKNVETFKQGMNHVQSTHSNQPTATRKTASRTSMHHSSSKTSSKNVSSGQSSTTPRTINKSPLFSHQSPKTTTRTSVPSTNRSTETITHSEPKVVTQSSPQFHNIGFTRTQSSSSSPVHMMSTPHSSSSSGTRSITPMRTIRH